MPVLFAEIVNEKHGLVAMAVVADVQAHAHKLVADVVGDALLAIDIGVQPVGAAFLKQVDQMLHLVNHEHLDVNVVAVHRVDAEHHTSGHELAKL